MKTTKILMFLFLVAIPFFGFKALAFSNIQNISDICNSEVKENFKSFCEKNGNAPLSLDIFGKNEEKDESEFHSTASFQRASSFQNEEEIIIEENEEWSEDRVLENKIVAIMPGTELKIKEGVTIYLKNSFIAVAGKLVAEGTKENPIIFKRLESENNKGFFIYSGLDSQGIEGDEIVMNHVDISDGIESDYENEPGFFGVLTVGNAKLEIKESSIHGNGIAIMIAGDMPEQKTVNRTKFFDNQFDVVGYCIRGNIIPNFEYNWWGPYDQSQWKQECYDDYGCFDFYSKVVSFVDMKPRFVSQDFFDPIIIVPGILGSATKYVGGIGKMELDPILHTYDNLVASFEKNGYEKGKNLFEFPYEWRDSNILTAQKLKEKIDEVKTKTGLPSVDLVAHSMGGLVARYYIEGDGYENDVNQLVTLGTPHRGSPKSYPKWEAGEGFFSWDEVFAKIAFQIEAHVLGYDNLKDYIQSRVISVKELLPDYDYLQEVSSGEMRKYPDNYPQNTFLDFLNSQERLDNLKKISLINIIGNTNENKTITRFRTTESTEDGKWEHGMPENFYENPKQGIIYEIGDETVPIFSSSGIVSDNGFEINSSHGDLPSDGQCLAINNLSGKNDCEKANVFDKIRNVLTFGVFSPIDVQVIDPDGKRVGKNFETGEIFDEIPGAFYSGFETENEFLTIPNPIEGEYKLIVQGTGSGEYKIEINRISENEEIGETKEITASIFGSAQVGMEKEQKVAVSKEEIKIIEENPTVDSIIKKINDYYNEGLIKKKGDKNFLLARMFFVKEIQEMIEKIEANPFLKKRVKERMVDNFKFLIN